ncbi:hypothetical protein Tco_1414978 [Tanacetum coccineum]
MAYRLFDTVTKAGLSHSISMLLRFLFPEPIILIVYHLFQLFKTLSRVKSRSPEYNLFSDLEENSEEEVAETMAETMEQYMKMQEVILFYNGLDVPTRQILDSKGAIPTKTAADAKVAIQEMA